MFLKKPMQDTTVGDTLLIHVVTVTVSVLIPIAIQTWLASLDDD